MSNTELLTISAYARHLGVAASTVSRGVSNGRIPSVEANGRRLIDPVAADRARKNSDTIRRGHGGRADRAQRRAAIWRARGELGFDPGQFALLNVMRSTWPEFTKRLTALFGADELNQARAVVAVGELIEYAAVCVYLKLDDYRDQLDVAPELHWSPKVSAWIEEVSGEGSERAWCGGEHSPPAGDALADEILDATSAASPEQR